MGNNYGTGKRSGNFGSLKEWSEGTSVVLSTVRKRTPIVYVFAVTCLLTFLIASESMTPDFSVLIKLAASSFLVALATYLYNDLTDYKTDKANKRDVLYSNKRDNDSGQKNIAYNAILYCTIACFAVSGILAFSIGVMAGAMAVVFAVLAIAYSHPKTHLKDMFVIKTVITAAGGFVISLMGFFAANSFSSTYGIDDIQTISLPVITSSAVAFLFYFVLGPLGDIGDIYGDKKGGRKTIPIVIGINKTFLLMYGIVGVIGTMLILSYLFFGISVIGLILGIATTIIVTAQIKKVSSRYNFKQKIKNARTTLRYSVFAIQSSLLSGVLVV